MNSFSQAGQDIFCVSVLGENTSGCFIDIGCSHPVDLSNTYALEQLGWRGILFDSNQPNIDLCIRERKSRAICGDARSFDWRTVFESGEIFTYLSLDVDEHQIPALHNLFKYNPVFAVMTVETDRYRFGDKPHDEIVRTLTARGYDLIADDVMSKGCKFETFWVNPKFVDMKVAEKFRSVGLDWADVLEIGGVNR